FLPGGGGAPGGGPPTPLQFGGAPPPGPPRRFSDEIPAAGRPVPRRRAPDPEPCPCWESVMSLFTKSLAVVPLLVCCGAFAPAARPDEKPKFEVRKAEAKPTDGLTAATIAGTTEKIYLHKDAALTSKDIAKAEASIDA